MGGFKKNFLKTNQKLILKAESAAANGDSPKAIAAIKTAIRELKNYNQAKRSREGEAQLARAYYDKGIIYAQASYYSGALECLTLSQELYGKCGLTVEDNDFREHYLTYAASFGTRGRIEEEDGKIPEALNSFQRQVDLLLQLFRAEPDFPGLKPELYLKLVRIMDFCLKYDLGKSYLEYAEEYLDAFSPKELFLLGGPTSEEVLSYMAHIALLFNDYEKAKSSVKRAVEALQEKKGYPVSPENKRFLLGLNHNVSANLEFLSKNYRAAQRHYQAAGKLFEKALKDKDLEKETVIKLKAFKLKNLCDLTMLYGEKGGPAKKVRFLADHKEDFRDDPEFESYPADFLHPILSEIFRFYRINVKTQCELGNIGKAMAFFLEYQSLLEKYDKDSRFSGSPAITSFKVDAIDLSMDFSITLMDNLEDETNLAQLDAFLTGHIKLVRGFNKEFPLLVNQEKLEELESKYALFKERL